MAELFGIISGGIGAAAFALQIETSIDQLRDRARRLKSGEAAQTLQFLSGRLELLKSALNRLPAVAGHPIVDETVTHCSLRFRAVNDSVAALLARFPDGPESLHPSNVKGKGKKRWKQFRLSSKRIEEEMRGVHREISDIFIDLTGVLQLVQALPAIHHEHRIMLDITSNTEVLTPQSPTLGPSQPLEIDASSDSSETPAHEAPVLIALDPIPVVSDDSSAALPTQSVHLTSNADSSVDRSDRSADGEIPAKNIPPSVVLDDSGPLNDNPNAESLTKRAPHSWIEPPGDGGISRVSAYLARRWLTVKTCVPRGCACSCHRVWMTCGRFWSLELTPIPWFMRGSRVCHCDYTCFRFNLRVALSQYGIFKAFTVGLDLVSDAGRYTFHPAFQVETVVKYTSPGFAAIVAYFRRYITFEETKQRLVKLYRSDPTFRNHRNPAGDSYFHEIIFAERFGCGFGYHDQKWVDPDQDREKDRRTKLLRLFRDEFRMNMRNENDKCRLHYSRLGLELHHPAYILEEAISCGYDPSDLDPAGERWGKREDLPDFGVLEQSPASGDEFSIKYLEIMLANDFTFPGCSPLQSALLCGSLQDVQYWIARSQPLSEDRNFLGHTPFHIAVKNPEYLQLLLPYMWDPNIRDPEQRTPLIAAAELGVTKSALLLLAAGADPELLDENGDCFIGYALQKRHGDLVCQCLDAIKSKPGKKSQRVFNRCLRTALVITAQWECPDTLDGRPCFLRLIEMCDNVNFEFTIDHRTAYDRGGYDPSTKGFTLLFWAKTPREAQALLQRGFNKFNHPNSRGSLAVAHLLETGNAALTQFCIDNGTDLSRTNKHDWSLLTFLLRALGRIRSIWDSMDSLVACLHARIDVFQADECRCPCSMRGCDASACFGLNFSQLNLSWPLSRWSYLDCSPIDPIWSLEWAMLVEEFCGAQAAKEVVLSLCRRALCQDGRIDITHVCCHRGRGMLDGRWKPARQNKEAAELNGVLQGEMDELSGWALESLRTRWMLLIEQRYSEHLKELESDRGHLVEWGPEELSERLINHEEDRFVESYDLDEELEKLNDRKKDPPFDIVLSVAIYACWLQHERTRCRTSEFYHLHKPGWYERRLCWLAEYMSVMGVDASEVAHEMRFCCWEYKLQRSSTESVVDHEANAASFLEAMTRFQLANAQEIDPNSSGDSEESESDSDDAFYSCEEEEGEDTGGGGGRISS